MKVIPFVHEGLGNSSYLVGLADGEAIAVDPDRSAGRYLAAAEANSWAITHVWETHLHADFVSGARELQAAAGAAIWAAATADLQFPHRPVKAGDSVALCGARAHIIASPGHTPEHVAFVVDAQSGPPALFSGGSLIVGGAARTDLIAPDQTERLTRFQFQTLRDAFRALPDETALYPTHGGGSFCSTGAGSARTSTLGLERRTNPLFKFNSEDEFARWFPTTFPAAPDYFFRMRAVNRAGPALRRDLPIPPPSLSPERFERAASAGAVVVDTRPQAEFMRAHIPGALSITFRDSFATWLGWLVDEARPLLFVTGEESIDDVLEQVLLVGYERFAGVLAGGMASWVAAGRETGSAPLLDAPRGACLLSEGALALDVREANEFEQGHVPEALHIPLGSLSRRLSEVTKDRPVLTYCGHGERSATALSLLRAAGFDTVANLDLGIDGWKEAGYDVAR